MDSGYYTALEAAKILSCTRMTIYRLIKSGVVKAVVRPTPLGEKPRYKILKKEILKLVDKPYAYDGRHPKNKKNS